MIEQVNSQTNFITPSYHILKNELLYSKILNKSITEILYKQVILEKFIVSSKNIKDKYFVLHNDEIIRINKIIKYFNGEIKIEIIKLNYSSFLII
jgi:hypothetical protein